MAQTWTEMFRNCRLAEFILVFAFNVAGLLLHLIPPYKRVVPEIEFTSHDSTGALTTHKARDPSLSFPVMTEQMPMWLLLVLCFVVPLLFFAAVSSCLVRTKHLFRDATLGLLNSMALSTFLCQALKQIVGAPRPNFYALAAIGRESDGRRSFPSGHSAAAFAGLIYLAMFLLDAIAHTPDFPKRGAVTQLAQFVSVVMPTLMAGWIASTRTQDYYHHFYDVLAGSMIGIACAITAYQLANLARDMSAGHKQSQWTEADEPKAVIAFGSSNALRTPTLDADDTAAAVASAPGAAMRVRGLDSGEEISGAAMRVRAATGSSGLTPR